MNLFLLSLLLWGSDASAEMALPGESASAYCRLRIPGQDPVVGSTFSLDLKMSGETGRVFVHNGRIGRCSGVVLAPKDLGPVFSRAVLSGPECDAPGVEIVLEKHRHPHQFTAWVGYRSPSASRYLCSWVPGEWDSRDGVVWGGVGY